MRVRIRFVKWVSILGLCLMFAGLAHAQTGDRLPVSAEFWIGLAFTTLLALVAGYAHGIERRVSHLEGYHHGLQKQISDLRELVRGDYHPKDEVHELLVEIRRAVDALHRRVDYIAAGRSGSPFPVSGGGS